MNEWHIDSDSATGRPSPGGRSRVVLWLVLAGVVVLGGVALLGSMWLQRSRLQSQLLADYPGVVAQNPVLVRVATLQARPLYQRYCSGCHGANLQGNTAIGAPNLANHVCLYRCDVWGLERTILYGARAGQDKGHNITDMPAFGLAGRLSPTQIREVVQFVLEIAGRKYDPVAAYDGQQVFEYKAECWDCHGSQGQGNADYGAPSLRDNVWDWGGTPQQLYNSIYFGRSGAMPAWIGKLSLEQIRALAVWLYSLSHHPAAPLTALNAAGPRAERPR